MYNVKQGAHQASILYHKHKTALRNAKNEITPNTPQLKQSYKINNRFVCCELCILWQLLTFPMHFDF